MNAGTRKVRGGNRLGWAIRFDLHAIPGVFHRAKRDCNRAKRERNAATVHRTPGKGARTPGNGARTPGKGALTRAGGAIARYDRAMIDTGLVIAPQFVARILAGEKTWEIRTKTNATVRRIALAEKGGPLVATCTIGKSLPIRAEEFAMHFPKHRVDPRELWELYADRPVYAWPLSDVRPLDPPIKYQHPGGGSWVKLSPVNVTDWERLQVD